MSEIKHRYRILEAIDQLRRRKARPDVNRICSFMFRRFSVSCGETKSDLQKLIEAEIVIKVDYKGNTSYRNAAKWAMLPNYKNKQVIDSWNTSSILSSAVAELIVLEPDYLDIGVPAPELERHLLSKDNRRFNRKNLDNILKRELDNGTLVKLENGNYFLGEHTTTNRPQHASGNSNSPKSSNKSSIGPKTNKVKKSPNKPVENNASGSEQAMEKQKIEDKEEPKSKVEENSNSSNSTTTNNTENGNNVGFRVGGRQKRAKVMFDPSDNNLPKGRRKSTSRQSFGGGMMRSSHNHTVGAKHHHNSAVSNGTTAGNNNNNTVVNGNVVSGGNKPAGVGSTSAANMPSIAKVFINNATGLIPPSGICTLCKSFGTRVKGVPERLISCSDCTSSRAHLSCVDSSDYVGSARGRNNLWQCLQCKTCAVCDKTSQKGPLAACSSCGDGYHYICHTPQIPSNYSNISKWKCMYCQEKTTKDDKPSKKEEPPEVVDDDDEDVEMKEAPPVGQSKSPAVQPSSSPLNPNPPNPTVVTAVPKPAPESSAPVPASVKTETAVNGFDVASGNAADSRTMNSNLATAQSRCFVDPYEGYPIDDAIPDASDWSPEDVFRYFEKYFDAQLVQVFKDQEIDGKSLLLMKRSDVVSGLCIKLGPALKLYRHVKKLQIRRSDPKLLWS